MSEQPRPCPFCGGTDFVIAERPFDGSGKALTCQSLHCFGRMWGTDEEDVIARWNRRTPDPATAKLIRCIKADLEPTDKMINAFLDEWK